MPIDKKSNINNCVLIIEAEGNHGAIKDISYMLFMSIDSVAYLLVIQVIFDFLICLLHSLCSCHKKMSFNLSITIMKDIKFGIKIFLLLYKHYMAGYRSADISCHLP